MEKILNNAKKRAKKNRSIKAIIIYVLNSLTFRVGFILIAVILITMTSFYLFERGHNQNVKNLFDSFWYTIVTLATVGYGDITPVTFTGRIIGIFSILFGVIFVGTVSGKIASFLIDQQLRRGKGLLKIKNLQNHFIICGWKNDFQNIIDGVLESNPEIDMPDLVLINNAPTENMELFMTNQKYKLINFIHGDFIDESVLIRANIKNAKRILILADISSNNNPMEIDSRTILAIMTIRKLNRNIYTVAELLDEKFEKYLNMSHCDEIILTKHYERILLVNASSGTGISHVIRDLLAIENKQKITILKIPNEFVGISYKKAFDFYLQEKKSILIGLLENTGNFFSRKKEALSDAQKTPDISAIVENLKKVKELRANNPILNPGFDYVIKTNSMAIVVGESKG
jgi:voltage-gated potassium channel